MSDLYWHTVDPSLAVVLNELMAEPIFAPFRLVGGTALSLQLGHRKSVDIDLFTDIGYGEIDFKSIDICLRKKYNYVSKPTQGPIGFGRAYIVGPSRDEAIKLDIYHTDPFVYPRFDKNQIRLVSLEEIAAMKIDVIQRKGRKKDFWDVHELLDHFKLSTMIGFHKERYAYNHDEKLIRANFTNFSRADEDLDPVCLRGKYWELIKLDLFEYVENNEH